MTISPDELDRRMNLLRETYRAAGLKVTHQRTEIFSELARTDEHPDAETLYQRVHSRLPSVSRDTVYRTLTMLEEKGLLTRVGMPGSSRYDANTDLHHHFVCLRCGLIKDFTSSSMNDMSPPAEVRDWGNVEAIRVQIRGVCRECLDKQREDQKQAGPAPAEKMGEQQQ